MSDEKPNLTINSITNNGGTNTVTGDINQTTDASVNVSGDLNGDVNQNFSGGESEETKAFFQKLIDTMLDSADYHKVPYNEQEVTEVVDELHKLANSKDQPTPEKVAEAETKWQRIVSQLGPVVAELTLTAVKAIPVVGPIATVAVAVVTRALEMFAPKN